MRKFSPTHLVLHLRRLPEYSPLGIDQIKIGSYLVEGVNAVRSCVESRKVSQDFCSETDHFAVYRLVRIHDFDILD